MFIITLAVSSRGMYAEIDSNYNGISRGYMLIYHHNCALHVCSVLRTAEPGLLLGIRGLVYLGY